MQHNNWGKDRDLLAEAVSKVYSESGQPGIDTPYEDQASEVASQDAAQREAMGFPNDGEGNILERLEKLVKRLEEFSHTFDDSRESHEDLAQIITGIKDIVNDNLEA